MTAQLTVGQLREAIKGLPNDSTVWVSYMEWGQAEARLERESVRAISNLAESKLTIFVLST